MARDLRPKHKLCRTYGEKLCDSIKCPVMRRSFPPGVHGPNKRRGSKISGYGKQLREKQKAKRIYGILEKQFANYVAEASKKKGDTSVFLLNYLESRLDNVTYRAGLATSRAAARQIVNHGHALVNGKKVDIPSYRVKVGDVISIKDKSKGSKLFDNISEVLDKKDFPAWVSTDPKTLSAKILNNPAVEQVNFDTNLIVGFYSR